jgi:uncharacterized protein (DUF2164 family)
LSSQLDEERLTMAIELDKPQRAAAIASIERYFRDELDQRIGNIQAGALLNYFLEEIGPTLYNRGVADVQERMQARVLELDVEVHEDEFGFWAKYDRRR